MKHEVARRRGAWAVTLLVLALAGCGETAAKKTPDAGTDAGSGSGSSCTLDSSKLDNCSL